MRITYVPETVCVFHVMYVPKLAVQKKNNNNKIIKKNKKSDIYFYYKDTFMGHSRTCGIDAFSTS